MQAVHRHDVITHETERWRARSKTTAAAKIHVIIMVIMCLFGPHGQLSLQLHLKIN